MRKVYHFNQSTVTVSNEMRDTTYYDPGRFESSHRDLLLKYLHGICVAIKLSSGEMCICLANTHTFPENWSV